MSPHLILLLLPLGLWLAAQPVCALELPEQSQSEGRRALSQPVADLDASARERFFHGRSLFQQMWVVTPSRQAEVDGLGPLYNRLSCVACHPGNGRGSAPDGPDEELRAMLVRLSLPGPGPHGGPRPHPAYGDQLNESAIPGLPGEGRAALRYREEAVALADGSEVSLRHPELTLLEPGYGPFDGLLTSPRIGPALVGLGLLEALPEAELLLWADPLDRDGDGISGRPNRVWDAEQGVERIGRFGLKANVASLRGQIAGAFHGDLGITSPLHPAAPCASEQAQCQRLQQQDRELELSAAQLDAITFYHQALALPARRGADTPQVIAGERLFHQAGCAQCHRPQLRTAADATPAFLADRLIAPYSDLLLHDMGAGLADGRPDFAASGREWRTPPLWGLGRAEEVADQVGYLHDGRARNLLEAILWHGGEGLRSREAVRKMDAEARAALLAFLGSL